MNVPTDSPPDSLEKKSAGGADEHADSEFSIWMIVVIGCLALVAGVGFTWKVSGRGFFGFIPGDANAYVPYFKTFPKPRFSCPFNSFRRRLVSRCPRDGRVWLFGSRCDVPFESPQRRSLRLFYRQRRT